MKPCATVLLALAASIATAEQPEWLDALRSSGEETLRQMEQDRSGADNDIAMLGSDNLCPVAEDADDSMPPAEEGRAVAVADGGLLVDRKNSRITYIGNVRVLEERLQLRCRNRLYISFPSSSLKEGEDKAKQEIAPQANTAPKAESPAEPAAPAEQKKPASEPITVSAHDAMVDSVRNNILLRSEGAKGVPHIKCGGNELQMEAREDGGDCYLLADSKGDAHLLSGSVTLHWVDAQGRQGTLAAQHGRMDFNREHNTLYIDGPHHITMPDGSTLTGEESLCVTLHPAPGSERKQGKGFMAQFTSMDYDGVDKAVACGNVKATRPARQNQPAVEICGDTCTYNAATGECLLQGKECSLAYGPNILRTQESISLAPNGDITIHGEEITGVYTIPASKGEDGSMGVPVCGTFRSSGEIHFRAEDGLVTLTGGLQAQDDINHVHCSGPLKVQLKRTGEGVKGNKKIGMLNLAIASYGDVASVEATGDVDITYTDAQKQIPLKIKGDKVQFDIEHGTAHISATGGNTALLSYGDYLVSAQGDGDSYMDVNGQGDIDVQGAKLHADLPAKQDRATVSCSESLKLNRASGIVELGPDAELTYPGGIMTSKGVLTAVLTPGEPDAKPAMERYPHLSYNFSGVEKADTALGGTLRTEKASMECSGPISVRIAPPADGAPARKGDKDFMARVSATAEGDVAVLAKDSGGRLIRATGDKITLDGSTGTKVLTGKQVTLSDGRNTHTASGKGARVTVDRNNSARISGERQVTTATRIQEQTGDKTKKKP